MNAHAETDKCIYCQIDLIDIQQLTAPATQLTRVENKQLASSVMKCPVCGYSELVQQPVSNANNVAKVYLRELGEQAQA